MRGCAADGVEDAQRNQVAIGGGVGDVPSGGEDRGGKGPPHPTQVVGALRHEKRQGYAFPIGIGRRQQDVLPRRVAMMVVPAGIVIHYGTGGRMRRQIIDPTFANNPDFAPVTQAVSILSTGANGSSPLSSNGFS